MNAYIFGAGASRGSVEHTTVPVAAEFGRVLGEICSDWRSDYPSLAAVVGHLGLAADGWSLEPVWTALDWYSKLQPALPLPKPWTNEAPEIKKALLSVYGSRCDDAAACVRDDSTLAMLFARDVTGGDKIISFNYDTIVERVAIRSGRKLVSSPFGGEGLPFAKPHGSTSWTLDLPDKTLEWSSGGAPIVKSVRPEDVDHGKEPLLLGAVPIKSELIREAQLVGCVEIVFQVIAAQWRTVVESIRDCETLVVCGYSFPPEDRYGRFLFQEGLRLRGRGLRVAFYDLDANAGEREREILDAFRGGVAHVEYRGPMLPRAA
jgi:hypothetical protein